MVKTKTKKAPAAKSAPEKTGKKKQPGESQIKKQPFLKRMLFGEEKPDLSELEAGSTTILDILSPTTVDTKSRDYIIVDDVYHAYLYNQIYLARVTPIEDPDYSCAPFVTEDKSEVRGSRTSDLEGLADGEPSAACQEPQNLLSKNREDRASRTAKSAFPEPQKLTPSKKEKRKIDQSHMEVRPSVRAPVQDGRTDGDAEEELLDILDGCELECFAPETALVFENAIERLFYADSFRIGNATLPQSRVRAKLRRLDGMILREAESKLRANQGRNVKNSTAYTMAVLFNCIAESESDLMIDPYLNTICAAV